MARYTPEFLARLRAQYEDGDRPVDELAAEFHISTRTLGRLALRENWDRRSTRVRDVPRAMRLLEQAEGLVAQSAHSRASGNPVLANGEHTDRKERLGPRLRGDERENASAATEATPTPTLPLAEGRSAPAHAEGGERSGIDRLERLVLAEIEAEEARRAQRGERSPAATERGARTLAILTQTLQRLQRLRAGDLSDTDTPDRDSSHDDDMPHDIDEFRRDLARRIAAFMESRPDDGDVREDTRPMPLDETR